jgi:hypothetical protein
MDQPDSTPRVVVTVVRTGGIGGMRRQWRAEADVQDSPRWVALIDECPWDAPCPPSAGADRFVWRIRADLDTDAAREAEVPDSALTGPWAALVDAVRARSSSHA